MKTNDGKELLTVREVARRCHRSEETVRRWIWSGKLPAQKLGNQLFVESAAVSRMPPVNAQKSGRRLRSEQSRQRLYREYGYSPVVESIRESRGQLIPSRDDILRHIEEDEALQDEMFAKYGPVDAVETIRHVREE